MPESTFLQCGSRAIAAVDTLLNEVTLTFLRRFVIAVFEARPLKPYIQKKKNQMKQP